MKWFMGLGMVLQRRVWEVESLDVLLIMLAINHACISSGLRIIEINKQNRHFAPKYCPFVAKVAS